VLRKVNLDRLADRYFLEISLLCEAYFARAVLLDIPMQPVYAGETSSLSPVGSAGSFAPRLVQRWLYRMFMSYFMRDFNVGVDPPRQRASDDDRSAVWSAYWWVPPVPAGASRRRPAP
jgi:hypothetical protein